LRTSTHNTRSSSVPLLCVPFRRTSFARRSFSTAAPLTWNSATCCFKLRLSLSLSLSLALLSNPDLKLVCFLLLSANYSTYLFRQRLCGRLIALWRFINFVNFVLLWLTSADCLERTGISSTPDAHSWVRVTTFIFADWCVVQICIWPWMKSTCYDQRANTTG